MKTKLKADVLFPRLRVVGFGQGVPREDFLDGQFALLTVRHEFGGGPDSDG